VQFQSGLGKSLLRIGQDAPFFRLCLRRPTQPCWNQQWRVRNLWVWTPQIEIERRLALGLIVFWFCQGGLLDPLTEEEPPFQGRIPTAGEATRIPALAGGLPSIVPPRLMLRSPLIRGISRSPAHTKPSIRSIADGGTGIFACRSGNTWTLRVNGIPGKRW